MQAEPKPLIKSDWPIAALLAFSVVLWVLGERQQAGPGAEPFFYGLTGVTWYLVGVLLIAWVASRASVPRAPYGRVSSWFPPARRWPWSCCGRRRW